MFCPGSHAKQAQPKTGAQWIGPRLAGGLRGYQYRERLICVLLGIPSVNKGKMRKRHDTPTILRRGADGDGFAAPDRGQRAAYCVRMRHVSGQPCRSLGAQTQFSI